jgi:hypothetical protein
VARLLGDEHLGRGAAVHAHERTEVLEVVLFGDYYVMPQPGPPVGSGSLP